MCASWILLSWLHKNSEFLNYFSCFHHILLNQFDSPFLFVLVIMKIKFISLIYFIGMNKIFLLKELWLIAISDSKWKWKSLNHVWLFATPWTLHFSRVSSQHRDQTQVSSIAGRFLTSWATWESQEYRVGSSNNQIVLSESIIWLFELIKQKKARKLF